MTELAEAGAGSGATGPLWAPPPARVGLPEPAGDRFPLSLQQEFLGLVDTGDVLGPFGPMYTIVGGWRVAGPLDVDTLRAALADLVARHEALRTTVVHTGETAYQQVHPPEPPRLSIRQLPATDPADRDRVAEELIDEVEAGEFPADQSPQLAVVLGRFGPDDAVLVLIAHHVAVDGWSIQVLVGELAARYAARRTGAPDQLPAPVQYRQFVAWQRAGADRPELTRARKFWRETLRGARITPLPTDWSRTDRMPPATAYHRFLLPERLRTGILALAAATRGSPFMVLLAGYALLLHRRTGVADVVAATFTPGRRRSWLAGAVGSFYDLLPVRLDLTGCGSFRELIGRARQACLAAYPHEIPFLQILAEAPELMEPAAGQRAACCVFQVVQSPFMLAGEPVGELRYTAIRRRLRSQPIGSAIPDGALWSMELHRPGVVGSIGYTTNLFTGATAAGLGSELGRIVAAGCADPDQPLDRI